MPPSANSNGASSSSSATAASYASSSARPMGASGSGSSQQPSSSSSSSASSPASFTFPAPPTRARHHARSMSQENNRFPAVTTFNLSPPRRTSHGVNGHGHTHHPIKVSIVDARSSATSTSASSSPSSSPMPTPSISTRLGDSSPSNLSSPSSTPSTGASSASTPVTTQDTSPDRGDEDSAASDAASITSSSSSLITTAPSSLEGSPIVKKAEVAIVLPTDDDTRLKQLLEAQANRRPRLMRLTPAFASLPGRLPPIGFAQGAPSDSTNTNKDKSGAAPSGSVAFPSVDSPPSTSQPTFDPRKGKMDTGILEPPAGLQLDMSNLPTPSARDSKAPQSTSQLPELRTKSGRIVKPALRRDSHYGTSGYSARCESTPASVPNSLRTAKSTPNTPSVPKVVQFDTHLEHVKVFKFKQKPTAISRSGSPEQTETETEEERDLFPFVNYRRRPVHSSPSAPGGSVIGSGTSPRPGSAAAQPQHPVEEQLVLRLPNFPSSARLSVDKDVYLERIYLAEDLRSVKGTVRVRNISFEKWVAVRFTLDNWITVNEVSAEYSESVNDGQSDRFTFSIKLNELLNWPRGAGQHETKTMFLCIRYTAPGTEFWDNNDSLNYQLDFRKRQMPSTPVSTPDAARPAPRAQSISGLMSTAQHARVVEMVRRHGGVQAGKGGAFVDDLRRELDKLKSDEEDLDDRPPVITKKMAAVIANSYAGKQRGGRGASPPSSPGGKAPSSPMWSARYDWGESLRNSASSSSRTRASVYDYFNSKPTPAPALVGTAFASKPSFLMSKTSPPSNGSSSASTPLANTFGHARTGMLSPAVGNTFAHHEPTLSGSATNSANNSAINSAENSAPGTPLKGSPPLGPTMVGSGHSPLNGNSPPHRGAASPTKYFSFPPQRRSGTPLGFALGASSLEGSDEEEDQTDDVRVSRHQPSRITTMPRSAVRKRVEKDDGLVLENYDRDDRDDQQSSTVVTSNPSPSRSSVSSVSLFSPSSSISSMESEVTATSTTPEDVAGSNAEGEPTPRPNNRRRWTPPMAGLGGPIASMMGGGSPSPSAAEQERERPRSATDLSELIQKYCWSSESAPGSGASNGQTAHPVMGVISSAGHYSRDMQSPPLSGCVTPTADY